MGEGAGVLVIAGDAGGIAAAAAERAGLVATRVTSLSEGLAKAAAGGWSATIVALDVPGADLPLAERVAAEGGAGAVFVLAEGVTPELAMRAASAGIRGTFPIGVGVEELGAALAGVRSSEGVVRVAAEGEGEALIGSSRALLEVFGQVGRVAGSRATVLITGESGTGKEVVARAIHRASPRSARPFVAVNCAAIPEDLLESELFGHERGSFTGAVARKIGRFERAQGGTLFLDELGDMSLVLQAKILRAVQEREIERVGGEEGIGVDVRIVAATHRDLAALVASGEFREDLYYRLAVVRLHLPPLRERAGDVRELALHYARRFGAEYGRPIRGITKDALERLAAHGWPGNVRELGNVMERAVLAAPGEVITSREIDLDVRSAPPARGEPLPGYDPGLSAAEVESLHIARVLESVGGHLGRAAEILKLHRNTVSRKAQAYGIAVNP